MKIYKFLISKVIKSSIASKYTAQLKPSRKKDTIKKPYMAKKTIYSKTQGRKIKF